MARVARDTRVRANARAAGADVVGVGGAVAILLLSARSGGGYFPVEYLTMGLAAIGLAVALVVLRQDVPHPPRRAWVAGLGLAAYGGWVGLSSRWSPAPDVAIADFQRMVVYLALLVFGVLVSGSRRGSRGMVIGVWGALAVIAGAGVTSRLLPGLHLAPQIDPTFMTYRLSWPITYWNAQGAAAAMAVVLGIGIAADRHGSTLLRGVAAFSVPVSVVCVLLTVSRGSIVSLGVGLIVLVALSRRPWQTVAVAMSCAVPAAMSVALAVAEPSVVDAPSATPGLTHAGPQLLAEIVAFSGVAAAASVWVLSALRRRERRGRAAGPPAPRLRRSTPVSGVALITMLVVTLGVLALLADRLDGPVVSRTSELRSFIVSQQGRFLDPQSRTSEGLGRLGNAGGSRSDLYRVAIAQFESAPIVGAGTGAFPIRWLRDRETPQPVRNVHSLPLEALAETGLIGLGLLSAALGAVAWGALVARRRPTALPRTRAAGASAGIAAFLASCAVDWTWQIGSLAAAALLLGSALLGSSPASRGPQSRRAPAETERRAGPELIAPSPVRP